MRVRRLPYYAALALLVITPAHPLPTRSARARAVLAGAAALLGSAILVGLDLLPATRGIDPITRPLSEYAFAPDGWLFALAVVALALGLVMLVSALVAGRCLGSRSPARALLTACSACLVLVAMFREHESNGTVGTAGRIHWVAAMLAFGGLAVVPVLLGRHRTAACSRLTSLARRLAVCTGPCFVLVLAASLARYDTALPVPEWSFGVGERLLLALELAVAGLLTAWAWRGCPCHVDGLTPRNQSLQRSDAQRTAASSAAADDGTEPSSTCAA